MLRVGDHVFIRKNLASWKKMAHIGITSTMIRVYSGQEVVITDVRTYPIASITGGILYRVKLVHGKDNYNFIWEEILFDLSISHGLISIY